MVSTRHSARAMGRTAGAGGAAPRSSAADAGPAHASSMTHATVPARHRRPTSAASRRHAVSTLTATRPARNLPAQPPEATSA
jgi:hypothetical protein